MALGQRGDCGHCSREIRVTRGKKKKEKKENLESQWGKRDVKPLFNWAGRKSRPVRAITGVQLTLSGDVSHRVHTPALLEALPGSASHHYFKAHLLQHHSQPTPIQNGQKEKQSNRHILCLLLCPVADKNSQGGDCSGPLLWKRCRMMFLWHE